MALVRDTFETILSVEPIKAVPEDPDDDAGMALAVTIDADFTVTGDKHLLDLEGWNELEILTPVNFLKRIEE